MTSDMHLFPLPERDEQAALYHHNPQLRMLADGYHPATGLRLLDGPLTCSSCRWITAQRGSTRLICSKHVFYGGHSEATHDEWPACRAFEPHIRRSDPRAALPLRLQHVKVHHVTPAEEYL